MASHKENKDLPVFSLTAGKNGPKMNGATPVTVRGPGGVPLTETKPIVRATVASPPSIAYRWTAWQATMDDLAKDLADELHRPVTNSTELNGKYNFTLAFSRSAMAAATAQSRISDPNASPDIFSALQSIGLKLTERKDSVDVVVVDHIEKVVSEN